jgi:hypothetical protein
MQPLRPKHYAWIAAGLFAAEMVFAIVHRATGARYPGFSRVHDIVIDLGLTASWGAAVVACLVRAGWPAMCLALWGGLVSVIHGFNYSIALTDTGPHGASVPFLIAAGVQFYCVTQMGPAFFEEREHAPRRHFAWLARLRHAH